MAFNGLQPPSGPFFLAPGQSTRIWVMRPGGADYGAQWIMADPLNDGTPAALTVNDFTKERDFEIQNTQGTHFQNPFIRYWVTVTNTSAFPVRFSVQGGGNG